MNRREVLSAATAIGTVAVSGCLSTENSSNPSDEGNGTSDTNENPYESVVQENVRALENEDLESLKQTLHPNSPAYDQTVEKAQEMWSQYDLTYELEEVEITKRPESNETAAIQTMQVQQEEDCEGQFEEAALQARQDCGCEEVVEGQSLQAQQQEDNCENEAHVRFIQVTKAEDSQQFRDNRTEGTHILRLSHDSWKIWNTETESAEYL